MKQQITIIMLLMAFGLISYSANAQTELIYDGGVYQNNIKLTSQQVKLLMANVNNTDAFNKYTKGEALYTAGMILVYPSAILLICEAYNISQKKKDDYMLLIAGASGFVVSGILAFTGENKMIQAVGLYNYNLNNNKVAVNFGFTGNGIGLNVRF